MYIDFFRFSDISSGMSYRGYFQKFDTRLKIVCSLMVNYHSLPYLHNSKAFEETFNILEIKGYGNIIHQIFSG